MKSKTLLKFQLDDQHYNFWSGITCIIRWEANDCMRSKVGMRTSVFRNLDRSCGPLSHCKDGKWKLAAFTYFKLYKWICVVVFAEWSSLSHQVSTHTYLALERVFGLTTFILLWLVPNWPFLCKSCWEKIFFRAGGGVAMICTWGSLRYIWVFSSSTHLRKRLTRSNLRCTS